MRTAALAQGCRALALMAPTAMRVALGLLALSPLALPQLDVSSDAESCVDWEGRLATPRAVCLPHRPPLQQCNEVRRMSRNHGVGYYIPGSSCCSEGEEARIMQDLAAIMARWQGGLSGRCLDIVHTLNCAFSCSPQQSTFLYHHPLAPPPPPPLPPDTRTCVTPTCAPHPVTGVGGIDGDGMSFHRMSCDEGYHLRPGQGQITCRKPYCSSEECCEVDEPSCDDVLGDNSDVEYVSCGLGRHKVDDLSVLCDGACDDSDCCEANPSCGDTGVVATCVEAAAVSVDADRAACAAVTSLRDFTACTAVLGSVPFQLDSIDDVANTLTLATGSPASELTPGQKIQLGDASGETCAASPSGADLVVYEVTDLVVQLATDLSAGDAAASTHCVVYRSGICSYSPAVSHLTGANLAYDSCGAGMVRTQNLSHVCQAEASRTLQTAVCQESDCCDRIYCSSYACGDAYELKPNHAEIPPKGTETSLELCCDRIMCSSFACNAGYKLRENHAFLPEQAGVATTNTLCCERQYCEDWTCSTGYERKSRARNVDPPEGQAISDDVCCDVTCAGVPGFEECPGSGDGPTCVASSCRQSCTDFACPAGYQLKADKDSLPPLFVPLSTSVCCDRVFCTGFECPGGWSLNPNHAALPLAGVETSTAECCIEDCSGVPGFVPCPGRGCIPCGPDTGRRRMLGSEILQLRSINSAPRLPEPARAAAQDLEPELPAHSASEVLAMSTVPQTRRLQWPGDWPRSALVGNGRLCERADACTYDQGCTATAAIICGVVELNGEQATCTSAGDCTYTPADGEIPESCTATAASLCSAVALNGVPGTCIDAGSCTFVETCEPEHDDFCSALPLDGTASSCSGGQPLCCVPDVVGRCSGNTDPANDVVCPNSWTFNIGPDAVGTSIGECCEAFLCTGNVNSDEDVSCEDGFAADPTVVRTQDRNPQAECCFRSCAYWLEFNTCAPGRHPFPDEVARTTSAVKRDTPSNIVCCPVDITGKCAGNTDPSADVVCDSWTFNKGSETVGSNAATCCEPLACSDNTIGTAEDVDCGDGLTLISNSGAIARTQADSTAECCVQSCGGWYAEASNDCAPGTHFVADTANTASGDSPETTCCAADVTGKCGGNTDPSEDFDCGSNSWIHNKGAVAVGDNAADCCEPYTCSDNADPSGDVVCPAGLALDPGASAIVRTRSDSIGECCVESCAAWAGNNQCALGTHLSPEAPMTPSGGMCLYTAEVIDQDKACFATDPDADQLVQDACSQATLDGTDTEAQAACSGAGACTFTPATVSVSESCEALASANCAATGIDGLPQALCSADMSMWFNRYIGRCMATTQCVSGQQYETVAPTSTSDRECRDLTVCNLATSYEDIPPTATTDRRCAPLTQCHPTEQFASVPSTPTSDRQCAYKVEALVCRSFCEVIFAQCGDTLPEPERVTDAVAFCELLFLKDQIRVEDPAIDTYRHDAPASNGVPVPHCLYVDTPPIVRTGMQRPWLIFTDEVSVAVPVSITDAEDDDKQVEVIATSANSALVTLSMAWSYGVSSFMLTATPRTVGTTEVTVCGIDSNDGQDCDSFQLEIRPDQTPPEIEMPPQGTVMEDSSGMVMVRIIEVDRPPELVTLSVTSSDNDMVPSSNVLVLGPFEEPCNVTDLPFPVEECRFLRLTPMPDKNGEVRLYIEADDSVYTGNSNFTLTVGASNDPPTITSEFADVVVDEDVQVYAIQCLGLDDGDPVINSMTGRLSSGDLVLEVIVNIADDAPASNSLDRTTSIITKQGAAAFTFKMVPPLHSYGEATVWVQLTDGEYLDRREFHWTVLPVNDAPIISRIPTVVTDEDVSVLLPLPVVDVDNPMEELRLTGTSSNGMLLPTRDLEFNLINGTWFLLLTPLPHTFGMSVITLRVTDGLLSTQSQINFTVVAVNDPPDVTNVRQNLNNTKLLITQFTLTDVETPSDAFKPAVLRTALDDQGLSDIRTMEYVLPCRTYCIYAATTNPILVPLSSIRFGGDSESRFVSIVPNQVMSGPVLVSVFIDDLENITRIDLSYDLISSTVDMTITLGGSIDDFGPGSRAQARQDIAAAAGVDVSRVAILDVRAGSIILLVAIKVDTPEAGKAIAGELSRLASFGLLEIRGLPVESLELSVVGETFEVAEWESMNDPWGCLAGAVVCLLVAMLAAARTFLVTQSTHDELIHTLKSEIIEQQEEDGFLALKKNVEPKAYKYPPGEEPLYLECDIRHIIIWVGVLYESCQLAWIVIDADAQVLGWREQNAAAKGALDLASTAMLDLHGETLFDFSTYIFGIYALVPGLWLGATVLFVIIVGYATFFQLAWNNHGLMPMLDRMVRRYWKYQKVCANVLLLHRDELCGLLFDGIMYVPVLRTGFKMLSCRFDLPVESTYSKRTEFRAFGPTLYVVDDVEMVCWSWQHYQWAIPALALILGFVYTTVRFTAELKGRPGGAMRFSARVETVRVIALLFVAAASELGNDRPAALVWTCLVVSAVLLAMNVRYQPALGRKGAELNAARSGLLATIVFLAAGSIAVISQGGASPVLTGLGIALTVFCCVAWTCGSRRYERYTRAKITRHIEKALAGNITETASLHHQATVGGAVIESQLKEFVHSSVDMLFLVLDSVEAERRAEAASALGEISLSDEGNAKVLNIGGMDRLMDLLEDESAAVRVSAMLSLANLACTDAGLEELGNPHIVPMLQELLAKEENDMVFGPLSRLLCTVMYCHVPKVRADAMETLLGMTSHLDNVAREAAWSAIHKLGVQTDHLEAQDEITARLIEMLLRRKNTLEQRTHAARKLYDIVDDNTHDTSHIEAISGVSKTLTDKQVNTILGGVLASNDPTLDNGEDGANLVRCCSQLLRLMASTHSDRVRGKIIATTIEALTSEALEREGIETFKGEIRKAARRIGAEQGVDLSRATAEEMNEFWRDVFRQYDDDGSGELDIEEFTDAMRRDAEIPKHKVPDEGLQKLFNAIDVDGGGSIDAEEFSEFLNVPYQPEPAFTTLYQLVKTKDLQTDVFAMIRKYMDIDAGNNKEKTLRREMAAVALEELSGQDGVIDQIFGDMAALEAFIKKFQQEKNDKVASALAYVLINFANVESNLDKLFEAGIFDDLASAIKGASVAKTESLIIIVGGVVKKHSSRASGPIVDIFCELIETEQWEDCKEAGLAMLLNFCDLLPQFCKDALDKILCLVERGGSPALQLPAIEVLTEIAGLKRCIRHIVDQGAVNRVLGQLARETALGVAREMGFCLCVLASTAPPGEKVVINQPADSLGSKQGAGLARFKSLVKRVIEHKDMVSFVFATVMKQLNDGCRFPAVTLQQLVGSELKERSLGFAILEKLRGQLRMQDLAEIALEPRRRQLAADALAIIAAEPLCRPTLLQGRTIELICNELLPYEFGFERVACRALARMAFESADVCDDISKRLMHCLTQSPQWAVREGACCTFGLMALLKPSDRPRALIELGPVNGSAGSPIARQSLTEFDANASAQSLALSVLDSGEHVIESVMRHGGVAALLRAVRDEEFDVGATACLALGNIANEGGAVGAHCVLESEGKRGVKGAKVLASAMTHMDAGVRTNAAMALGALGSHTRAGFEAVQEAFGLSSMVAALSDKSLSVRTALAFSIGQVASGSASQLVTAPVVEAHESRRRAEKAATALRAAQAFETALKMGDTSEEAEANRRRRVIGFEKEDEEDSSDEEIHSSAQPDAGTENEKTPQNPGSWGVTRAVAPVVVIPGTNAAVDALLRAARDDLPAMRKAAIGAVSTIFFPKDEDRWIRDVVAQHAAGLRYKQGERLADAEQGFNKAALEMSAAKRVKLEALCSRARAVFMEGGKTNY